MASFETIRKEIPFFTNLPDSQILYIQQVAAERAGQVERIASLLSEVEPHWNQILRECDTPLLLAVRLIHKEIDKTVFATAWIFYDRFIRDPQCSVEYEHSLLREKRCQKEDWESVPQNQRCVLIHKLGASYSYSIYTRCMDRSPIYLEPMLEPMLYLSKIEEMVQRLLEGIHDVGLPIPGETLRLHGLDANVVDCLAHDTVHAHYRHKVIADHGKDKYDQLLHIAKQLIHSANALPPYSVPLITTTVDPLLEQGHTIQDEMKHLLLSGAGMIVDALDLEYIDFEEELDPQHVARELLTFTYAHFKVTYKDAYSLSPILVKDTLNYLYPDHGLVSGIRTALSRCSDILAILNTG